MKLRPSCEVDNTLANQETLHFLRKQEFITLNSKARHQFLCSVTPIQSTPSDHIHFKSHFNIIFPSMLRSYIWVFISDFPTKI
jgi:hypothetical protein